MRIFRAYGIVLFSLLSTATLADDSDIPHAPPCEFDPVVGEMPETQSSTPFSVYIRAPKSPALLKRLTPRIPIRRVAGRALVYRAPDTAPKSSAARPMIAFTPLRSISLPALDLSGPPPVDSASRGALLTWVSLDVVAPPLSPPALDLVEGDDGTAAEGSGGGGASGGGGSGGNNGSSNNSDSGRSSARRTGHSAPEDELIPRPDTPAVLSLVPEGDIALHHAVDLLRADPDVVASVGVGAALDTTSAKPLVTKARTIWARPKIVPVPKAVNGPWQGHADSRQRKYDIWSDNCHTAANAFVLQDRSQPKSRGVVACARDPRQSVEAHTANWEVRTGNLTCLFNWGEQCCWQSSRNPPDVKENRDSRFCAQFACGAQYGSETRALPAGELVELPGPGACAREMATGSRNNVNAVAARFDPSKLTACLTCCTDRASHWNGKRWGLLEQQAFGNQCQALCRGFFQQDRTADKPETVWGKLGFN